MSALFRQRISDSFDIHFKEADAANSFLIKPVYRAFNPNRFRKRVSDSSDICLKEADAASSFLGEPVHRASNPNLFRDSNLGPSAWEAGALTSRAQERPVSTKDMG